MHSHAFKNLKINATEPDEFNPHSHTHNFKTIFNIILPSTPCSPKRNIYSLQFKISCYVTPITFVHKQ